MSLMTLCAMEMDGGEPAKCFRAFSFFTAPSSCRMLVFRRLAMNSATSSGMCRSSSSALRRMMAIRVSKSGMVMSVIRPHSNRVRIRSSSVFSSLGGLSDVMTICLFSACNLLKVWKNSSCIRSLSLKNWISSISRTSAERYLSWKLAILLRLMPLIRSFPNSSLVT